MLRAFWVVNHIKLRFHVPPANIPTWKHNFWNRRERAIYFGVYSSWIPTFPTDKHDSTFNKCLSRWQYLQNIYAYFSYNSTCVWYKMLLWFWWFALLRYDGGPFRQEFSALGLGVCLFAAVLSVFLKSSHFVLGLPTQRYYDLGSLKNKKLCRIWSRPNVHNRCLTLSHSWNYNHYHVRWRMSIFILVRTWGLFIQLNRH